MPKLRGKAMSKINAYAMDCMEEKAMAEVQRIVQARDLGDLTGDDLYKELVAFDREYGDDAFYYAEQEL
ncbi:hypothetical protein N9K75_02845 [bacterium]|nr:hypothetical protein [bacterium]